MKLKILKGRICDWAKEQFGDVRRAKDSILVEIQFVRQKGRGRLTSTCRGVQSSLLESRICQEGV